MTAAEQASLEALRATVETGFREIRDLIEKRRDQELEDHKTFQDQIDNVRSTVDGEIAVKRAADVLWGRMWKLAAFLVTTGIAAAAILSTYGH